MFFKPLLSTHSRTELFLQTAPLYRVVMDIDPKQILLPLEANETTKLRGKPKNRDWKLETFNSDKKLASTQAADVILIPCRPHLLDLQAIPLSVELARIAQKPFAVVLNAVPPKGPLAQEASVVLVQQGIPRSPM
jgi:hypothetical protein